MCAVGWGLGGDVGCIFLLLLPPDPADETFFIILGPGHELAAKRPGFRLSACRSKTEYKKRSADKETLQVLP